MGKNFFEYFTAAECSSVANQAENKGQHHPNIYNIGGGICGPLSGLVDIYQSEEKESFLLKFLRFITAPKQQNQNVNQKGLIEPLS